MKWFLGTIATFTFGGMAGLLLAIPGIDFQVHNSLFLVAHFHTMVIGGALFGIFAAISYWFPKVFGFRLDEKIGTYAFWAWLIGFYVSFIPLYILGLMGATRRLDSYDAATGWQPLFVIAFMGFLIIGLGAILQVVQVVVSIMKRKELRDTTGDPWDGRTLEWATASPAPFYNFAIVPEVHDRDAFAEMKTTLAGTATTSLKGGDERVVYEDIMMPKNTPMGMYLAGFAFLVGFAFVWHIIWLVIVGLAGAIACGIIYAMDEETEYLVPAAEIARIESQRK
jgi:cytochrome o ubiquinol oxidase subunit 1